MNRTLPALALLCGLLVVTSSPAQPKKDPDLDQVTAALTKLGGVVLTFEVTPTGAIQAKTEKGPPATNKVPVFRFQGIDDSVLAKLPKSEVSVGLDLDGNTKVGDAGMKSVANLKNLHMISLSRTKVGEEGL